MVSYKVNSICNPKYLAKLFDYSVLSEFHSFKQCVEQYWYINHNDINKLSYIQLHNTSE